MQAVAVVRPMSHEDDNRGPGRPTLGESHPAATDDDPTVALYVRVPASMKGRIEAIASRENVKVAEAARAMLRGVLAMPDEDQKQLIYDHLETSAKRKNK